MPAIERSLLDALLVAMSRCLQEWFRRALCLSIHLTKPSERRSAFASRVLCERSTHGRHSWPSLDRRPLPKCRCKVSTDPGSSSSLANRSDHRACPDGILAHARAGSKRRAPLDSIHLGLHSDSRAWCSGSSLFALDVSCSLHTVYFAPLLERGFASGLDHNHIFVRSACVMEQQMMAAIATTAANCKHRCSLVFTQCYATTQKTVTACRVALQVFCQETEDSNLPSSVALLSVALSPRPVLAPSDSDLMNCFFNKFWPTSMSA